jgi:23S rRNA pseudouridine1911/1915/1917 synthase
MTLLDRLIQQFPTAKRETFRRMISDGRVKVNGRAAEKLKQDVEEGDAVEVLHRPEPTKAKISLPFKIVAEDKDILLIDKPAGLLTSTVPREKRTTALQLVKDYLAETDHLARPGLIHRLDRDASGLLIFSKNDAAYQSLKTQFFHHTVKRVYTAIVSPIPKPAVGRIESHLVEWADGKVHSTKIHAKGQEAVTDYETVAKANGIAALRVTLETGRKHQIRVHLSEKGWPIVGDVGYGGKPHDGGMMLAATEIAFDHPVTKQRKEFRIEVPARMRVLLAEIEQ